MRTLPARSRFVQQPVRGAVAANTVGSRLKQALVARRQQSHWLSVVLVMCCLTTLPAIAQNAARGSADDAAVREIVRKYVDAREKRDGKLLEALFTADADQLVTTGEWRQGRDNVVRGGLASSQANPGSRRITIETVRFVAPGVAIADGRYEIADAQAAAPRRMRTTFVIVRAENDWRIAAIRNMAPTDPAR